MHQKELSTAKNIAEQAGQIMLQYFDSDMGTELKSDKTPITIADKLVNRLVIDELANVFPDDGVVGEEESTADYGMGRRWICDPIDGTAGFVWGVPTAMFSLALVIDGKPVVGVAYQPHLKKIYIAVKNQGAFLNKSTKLQVSNHTMEQGDIGLAPDFITKDHIDDKFLRKLLSATRQPAIFPGAVFRSCQVAEGRLAGFPHPSLKPYDIAAAHLIVEESGGKVTGINGDPLDYSQVFHGAVISNGVCHEELLGLFD